MSEDYETLQERCEHLEREGAALRLERNRLRQQVAELEASARDGRSAAVTAAGTAVSAIEEIQELTKVVDAAVALSKGYAERRSALFDDLDSTIDAHLKRKEKRS